MLKYPLSLWWPVFEDIKGLNIIHVPVKKFFFFFINSNIFLYEEAYGEKSAVCRFVNDSVIEISLRLKSLGRSGRELWVETRLRNRCRTVGVVISAQTLHLPTEQHEHSKTQCAFPMLSERYAQNEPTHLLPIIPSLCWKHSYNLMDVWSVTRWTWTWCIIKPKPVITVTRTLVIGTLGPLNNKKEPGLCLLKCICHFVGKIGLQRLWFHLLLTQKPCSP